MIFAYFLRRASHIFRRAADDFRHAADSATDCYALFAAMDERHILAFIGRYCFFHCCR